MFKKKLVYFNQSEFNQAKNNELQRLKYFENVKLEASKIIELPTNAEGLNKLLQTPYAYVEDTLKTKHHLLPFPYEKLLELLNINTVKLEKAIEKMNNHKANISYDDDLKIITNVYKSDFETWTTNQAENTKFEKCQEFINLFNEYVGDGYNNQNLHNLIKATKDMLQYDSFTSSLIVNPSFISSK